ncbi:hypothetical protein [uncultured Amphritea sp.]|uniref:hypothetical protein n=1 Tax=uncultured Amphritea sp. TaxID=981605 RepID=UPI00262BD99D|nr:hypothetical protein [uncultured Amphritea sp.]
MSETHTPEPFALGRRSKKNLQQVHPDLVAVVERGLALSAVDFAVTEGVREIKRQRRLVKTGDSATLNSRHLPRVPTNNPELGEVSHAVDLAAWVDGTVSYDWPYYYQIAAAIKQAAAELNVAIRWGGGWALLDTFDTPEAARQAYIERKNRQGKKVYSDGPHFELCWEAYPCL